MFLITIFGQKQLFLNSKNDDFLKGLADNFECEFEEMDVQYVDEVDQKLIRREMRMNSNASYKYDLGNKKLQKITAPTMSMGQLNPRFILNKEVVYETDAVGAISENDFNDLSEENKKEYLKGVVWNPRQFEKDAFLNFFGAFTGDEILKATDPECNPVIEDVISFSTKKVLSVTYKQVRNSITGELSNVMDKMIIEGE